MTEDKGMKVLALRREDTCSTCHTARGVGTKAASDQARRQTRCLPCHEQAADSWDDAPAGSTGGTPAVAEPAAGPGGVSAQREYEKRASRREQQIRSRHP